VAGVVRLVTLADADDDSPDSRQISVTARHEAVLDDDDRVLLLDDRGWSESGPPDIWVETSVSDIVETARTVVGPDEPFGVRSHQDMAAEHWGQLAAVLRRNGVVVDAGDLPRLPHDVVLSERLLVRFGQNPGDIFPW